MSNISSINNLFKYPRWIVIQLLEECNLRCKMCYEWGKEGSYHNKKKLSKLDIDVVKKIITDCAPVKPYYDLFGGEPLLYKDIAEVIEAVGIYGSGLDIPTNGTLLSKNAEMLVETAPTRIWLSLDGPKEINDYQRGKGVFDKVKNGIQTLFELRESKSKKFPKIGVSFIVTADNHMYVEEMFFKHIDLSMLDHLSIEMQLFATNEQCNEHGRVLKNEFGVDDVPYAKGMIWDMNDFKKINIKELSRQIASVRDYCNKNDIFIITYPKVTTEENLQKYLKGQFGEMEDKIKKCGMPWVYTEITANGDVAPCHTYYDLTFGNVNEKSILEIWNSPEFSKYRKYMQKNLLPICTACSRYYVHNTKEDAKK